MDKNHSDELAECMHKILAYIQEHHIGLSKKGKERLSKRFPNFKDEIMNLEEVRDEFSVYRKPTKKE